MPSPPLISGRFPIATPGPAKDLGYAYVRSAPLQPHITPAPINTLTDEPALRIEEVGYAIFYPCGAVGEGKSKGMHWFPKPAQQTIEGYERFLSKKGVGSWLFRTVKWLVRRLKFDCHPEAPLLGKRDKYPLIIFSHGLAGTRHAYSHYCTALASRGYVVLAVEHRDGSGPAVVLPSKTPSIRSEESLKSKKRKVKSERRVLKYIREDEISWPEGQEGTVEKFRTLQLEMRVKEVYEAYYSFKRLVAGDLTGIMDGDGVLFPVELPTDWIRSFRDKVDFDKFDLTGHSFGGGTLLHLLHSPPPDPAYAKLPISKAIALDPWIDPIPKPEPNCSPPSSAYDTHPPLLVIDSTQFTEWDDHFQRLLKVVRAVDASFVTLSGSGHQSFSDFPLIASHSPHAPDYALNLLKTIHDLSNNFLEGRLPESNHIKGKEPDQGDYAKGKDGKMAAAKGSVVVHMVGRQPEV